VTEGSNARSRKTEMMKVQTRVGTIKSRLTCKAAIAAMMVSERIQRSAEGMGIGMS
jgi:hypothetical protein